MSRAPRIRLVGLGAGLAAAGVGAAAGLVAERLVVGRRLVGAIQDDGQDYGRLSGQAHVVEADDGTALHADVDELDVDGTRHPDAVEDVTLVFSHGFALSNASWHFQRQALRGRYRMVFWDQRGHGRSARGPVGSLSVDQAGQDLHRVIDALAPDGDVVLVGHSMGGMTIMAYCGEHADEVRERIIGAVLVSTSAGGLEDVHWGWGDRIGRIAHRTAPGALATLARSPALVDRARRIGSDLEQMLVRRYSYASPVSPALVRFTAGMIASTPIDVVSELLPRFDVHDKREALAALHGIELLVMSGSEDLLTPVSHSDEIVRLLPGAEHVVVEDAGHLLMLERPDVVTDHMIGLVERARRANEAPRARHRRRRRGGAA